jgi:two-component system, cell cycle sensor histidine kinase and response regulator CckA
VESQRELIARVRELEAELARREAAAVPMRALIEDMSELIVRWKPDGTRLFVNDAYCRLFGLTREQAIGSSFWPLVDELDLSMVKGRIAALDPERPVSSGLHRAVQADGSVFWMEWVDRGIFDTSGTLVELQSVGRDVTERMRLEEQSRRVERADAAARASAGIGHDLRNVFQVISGVAWLLEEAPEPGDLAKLRSAIDNGMNLLNQLSRLTHGLTSRPRAINLNDSVTGLRGLLLEIAQPAVILDQRLHPGPRPIQADTTQIDQVLLNLVRNSVEALPTGGRVTIETDQAVCTELQERYRPPGDLCALLRVTDNGPGISDAILPRVFDPRISTKPNRQGLGLATVKAIVDGHRGTIRVASTGQGTTFELAFPTVA